MFRGNTRGRRSRSIVSIDPAIIGRATAVVARTLFTQDVIARKGMTAARVDNTACDDFYDYDL